MGLGTAHSLWYLKMIMRFCTEMVLDYHVGNHVAKGDAICDFHLLGFFSNGGDQQNQKHHHNHTSQEVKNHMQVSFANLWGALSRATPTCPAAIICLCTPVSMSPAAETRLNMFFNDT